MTRIAVVDHRTVRGGTTPPAGRVMLNDAG
jgi:hypothetical protein